MLTTVATIALAGLAVAACSSSKGATSTTSSNGGSNATGSSATTGGSGSTATTQPVTAAAKLTALQAKVSSAKDGTFKASYAETSSSSNGTLTFEQQGSKYLFSVTGANAAEILDTGKSTYVCSGSEPKVTCYSYSSADNPFASILNVITGASVSGELKGLKTALAAKVSGVKVSFSTETFAGNSAQCFSGTENGNSFKYCVLANGVLAYAGGTGSKSFGSISLNSYSTSPSSSDFNLPSGATVVTLPTSGSTP
jgi:hypothetical protein